MNNHLDSALIHFTIRFTLTSAVIAKKRLLDTLINTLQNVKTDTACTSWKELFWGFISAIKLVLIPVKLNLLIVD